MGIETTCFFVKPHAIHRSREIFGYLVENLTNIGRFNLDYKGINIPSSGFYEEFYSDLKNRNPEAFKRVMDSYPCANNGRIAFSLIKGDAIIKIVKIIVGPTMFEDNSNLTIRGKFGPYEMPDTIVHASSNKEEAKKDINCFKKFGLI